MSDDERKEGSNRKLEVVHSGSGKESKSDKKGVEGETTQEPFSDKPGQ